MISLKQLRYFEAVARAGHFGRAAEQCAVTQPALSMQVQELEHFLGLQLLERGRGGVILTEGGKEIARRASQVLADVRDIVDFARQQGGTLSGPLGFGVIPSVAPYILPQLLPTIRTAFPDLDLHIRETQTQLLLRELVDGRLDLLLLALPVEHPEVETARLFEDRFLLAMPPSYQVSNRVHATPDLLEGDRLLLLEEGHCFRAQALAFCNRSGRPPRDLIEGGSLSTLVQMVGAGIGVTLIPEMALALETRSATIDAARLPAPRPTRTVGMIWRATNPLAAQFLEVARLVREAAEAARERAGRERPVAMRLAGSERAPL